MNSVWSPCLLHEEVQDLLARNITPAMILAKKKIRLMREPAEGCLICAFFNAPKNKCRIYSFRPFECRLYPFLIKRGGKKVFLAVDLKCPFVTQDFKSRRFNGYVQYLTRLLHKPKARGALRDNPQLIQMYDGPLDLTELKL